MKTVLRFCIAHFVVLALATSLAGCSEGNQKSSPAAVNPALGATTTAPATKTKGVLIDSTHGEHPYALRVESEMVKGWGYSATVNSLDFSQVYAEATETEVTTQTHAFNVPEGIGVLGLQFRPMFSGNIWIEAMSPDGKSTMRWTDTVYRDLVVNVFAREPKAGSWTVKVENPYDKEQKLNYNIKIGSVGQMITAEALGDQAVLVLDNPRLNFAENEVKAILTWVESGGSLLLIGEDAKVANAISNGMGVLFGERGELSDPTNNLGRAGQAVIHRFSSHPTTQGIEKVAILFGRPLTVKNPNAVVIATGDEDSFSAEFPAGTFPPIAAALEYGRGKVFFFNDGALFGVGERNDQLYGGSSDNTKFVRNIIRWLAPHTP